MNYVSVARRAVAIILDSLVFFVLGWPVALVTGGTTTGGYDLQGGPVFLTVLLWFIYMAAMEATLGATLGKLALGLRVIKTDGSPIGWSESLIRNVLRIVDGLFFYLVGAILVWASPLRQRLGDRAANTVVVRP